MTFTFSRALVLVACIIFVLAAFHVAFGLEMIALGLAVYMASLLVP